MKVTVIGCNTTWSNKPTSSYCINDSILVDCGEGTLKNYKKCNINIDKISNIFITHLHGDHVLAIVNIVYSKIWPYLHGDKNKINIYGPLGTKNFLKKLLNVLLFEHKNNNIHDIYNIIEIKDYSQTISVENLNVSCFKLKHGSLVDIGYIFKEKNFSVGFSGDCIRTKNLEEFVKNSNVLFLECCELITSQKHLGFNDFNYFEKKYPEKTFYGVHFSDKNTPKLKKLGVKMAISGKTYNF